MTRGLTFCVFVALGRASHAAFVVDGRLKTRSFRRSSTAVNLDPRIAAMVDEEFKREQHPRAAERAFHIKNDPYMRHDLPSAYEMSETDFTEPVMHIQERRDRVLAATDPQRYCAERCLSTGFCDAFEDFFEFNAKEVVEFCNDCVLSEDEEPCDIPYDKMDHYLEKSANGELPLSP